MIKNLQKFGFILAAGLSLGSLNASAQTYEPFNGTGALNGSNSWGSHSGTANQIMKAEGSLMYTGLAPSQGNKIVLKATDSEDVNKAISEAVVSGNVYASFLLNVEDAATLLANTSTGNYFMHFAGAAGSSSAGAYVSRVSLRAGSEANTFNLGVLNSSGGSTGNSASDIFGATPTNYVIGQTYFVVLKYDMDNNTSSLWVNPLPGVVETPAMVTNAAGTASTRIETVAIRQSNSNGAGTGNLQLDELRVGTTWASVTPATSTGIKDFSEAGLGLFPNPTTGAVKLQLPASFSGKNKISLTVYNVNGDVFLKATGSEKALNEQLVTKMGAAAAGMYLVKIDNGAQAYQTRIVKN